MKTSKRKDMSKSYLNPEQKMSLTSLMDIMTIILLFLLQTFSADGNLIKKDKDNKLTYSSTKEKAKNISSIILTPYEIKIKKSVDGDIIPEYTTKLNEEIKNDSNMVIDNLLNGLTALSEEKKMLIDELKRQSIEEGIIEEQVKWEILIEADKSTPYLLLTKVLGNCGKAGFTDLKLITLGE
ncbi:MAG: biopolymer transporter ExbD [Candidatus Delongbacteria bacterium]|nr:biopolymer transporter ExbD [Candidatus Delongbacteria bacterium]MBN2836612.1 biopolymer transporter ExbD [Candidatus Delongbacteria bacterium]